MFPATTPNWPPQFAEGLPLWLAVLRAALRSKVLGVTSSQAAIPLLLLLAVPSAFILLAEPIIAITFGLHWHLSWWEGSVGMLAAFWPCSTEARASWA